MNACAPHATSGTDARAFGRVAIVHYWLVGMRGGERVLERLLQLFPRADIFTHVYVPEAVSRSIRERKVTTSFIQKLPGGRRHYQAYLPLMPLALEQLDLRGYDLVISSESGPAKGVIADPGALHLCYCHSPMRYLWDHYHDYLETAGWASRRVMPLLFHWLRQWDAASAARVDAFVANSTFIKERIRRAWRRDARVVHPPVPVERFTPAAETGENYLWVSQVRPYKRAALAVEAFNRLGLPLTIVGDGPQLAQLRKVAAPNITFKPVLSFAELKREYATCRALIFTPEEDFGIVPVEANASGRPVIALGRGGVLDSIVPEETGLFFDDPTVECLCDAVGRFERWLPGFDPASAVRNAARFAPERFDSQFLEAVACASLG
jgi:glycosyltransferase involved in cell wall biosynthesis